ncbi:hypothetical protein VIBNISFn27_750080 [Vibrio nigripulchritudo SFn27]|uniref:YkuD domain-containing protein n=1 Tax=Vibrio nigripulchritudo TaxID=28173 RepID=U4KIX7_9VIBR|nr:hypothetical protein [Vibrio nigripulchritudo]CCN83018.1 hypothetical protein VIBNIBLFn1_550065 [Vibrio nigripulchritudo BLFn1]CCN90714.1 hypothetical protein VIBNISFn27_750080 [Vibrio nigripulchritudo SFn27]CCN97301.1 hypothetical protein VIBNIENn2_920079 [Vibrio nigripulchritudo ENn2]CCO39937.1 hypothetical protein VIBNISFn135_200081 [Vibrio nigripulchritudo SFn135]CCO51078.1 hypothetical protein VIBNIWn13_1070081 [Vibrio nigripulchritudo Wn13]
MPIEVTFSIKNKKLVVKDTSTQYKIEMSATSGGWDEYDPLPKGKWVIAENPSGLREYFGLFYLDSHINDQFKDNGKWRDGIRFGYHRRSGSHGCIMARPFPNDLKNMSVPAATMKGYNLWDEVQMLIRTKGTKKVIRYQNDEIPHRKDSTIYRITTYGYLTVTD